MPILNFKEIPEAHKATGEQDRFEFFARDFLEFMGYKIVVSPDRGADGGKDLIVEEKRTGIGGETIIRWLVSCKHQAHSGSSVSANIESNIGDRIEVHGCQGFLGFYSTLPSSGLSTNLQGYRTKFEVQVFDREKIEKELVYSGEGLKIVERYFPKSFKSWKKESVQPVQLFLTPPSLKCKVCGKELFDQDDKGIITTWEIFKSGVKNPKKIEYVFWTCRGHCDRILSDTIHSERDDLLDRWEDISDVMIPTTFFKWTMVIINQLHDGYVYSTDAIENYKDFLLQISQYISRELTEEEKKRIEVLKRIPDYL